MRSGMKVMVIGSERTEWELSSGGIYTSFETSSVVLSPK